MTDIIGKIEGRFEGVPYGPEATEAFYDSLRILTRDRVQKAFVRAAYAPGASVETVHAALDEAVAGIIDSLLQVLVEYSRVPQQFVDRSEAVIIDAAERHVQVLKTMMADGGHA